MQYGGNQQRILNMMMQARQAQAQVGQPGSGLYSSYALPHHQASAGMSGPSAEPTFVTSLTENDVLLGRGTPCAENEGNVRFRRLVKQRKVEYIAAEKRMRKDGIAREILEVIASRGGKFLRKVESQAELEQLGVPPGFHAKEVWRIVDEDTQVQKVKQALRNKDDAAELIASAKEEGNESPKSKKFGEGDVTNRFPRGVQDQSDIHKADCNLQFGTGVLERASSNSSKEDKGASSSPKLKGAGSKTLQQSLKSPGSSKTQVNRNLPRRFDALTDADLMAVSRRSSMASTLDPLSSPANRRNLLAGRLDPITGLGAPGQPQPGLTNMMRRQMWDKSQAAPSDGELRTLQELQRLRMMREQNLMGAAPPMMSVNPTLGLPMDTGSYGTSLADQQFMMNAEYRQMQAQQQVAQMQQMAAAREQAAMAASLQRSSFSASGTRTPPLHPSAALAARQLQIETQTARRASLGTSKEAKEATATSAASRARSGADSAGERAIGIAQAMKRAEAFSPAESLEMSHLETLILSVLCSHGLPVWTPEAHSKSFVTLPTFAKRLDWTWYGFACVLKQKASSCHLNTQKTDDKGRVEELTAESALEYRRDPRELATKTIMLLEKLRRHCDTSGASAQRKQSGLGMRVPLWLDRELSRWAMTLNIADPTGRPVPFSSTDFVAEHAEYKEDPSVLATAAFDPPLADDVVEQVALLTRLRSVFVKTKGSDLRSKLEVAVQRAAEEWEDQPKGWDVEPAGARDLLLCDRLLSEGFSGVLASSDELGTEYQLGSSPRQYPSFESLSLTKSSIQQRANQIVQELHIIEEKKELQSLRLDRMERLAQLVLSSSQPVAGRSEAALNLLAGATTKKRKESITSEGSRSGSPVEATSAKKQKTTKE